MAIEDRKLHVLFLPYYVPSHLIPMVYAARLFAARGVKVTISTTPHNALLFQTSVDWDIKSGHQISVHTLKFPSTEVGLPEGIENFGAVTSPEMSFKVARGIALLQKPTEQWIHDLKPDCIFSDMFFPWTVDIADDLKIPRIQFYPSGFISECFYHSLKLYAPHEKVKSDTESFLVPGLPHKIEMTRTQIEDHLMTETAYGEMLKVVNEAKLRSYGVVHNTFYELEPGFADHYWKVQGWKCWHIGPLFQFFHKDKAKPSNNSISEEHICLSWLDTQKPSSVLYVGFGSMVRFPDPQLTEIALALEASNIPFVWVVRKKEKNSEKEESWLPKGFEKRMVEGNKGMIIRGWAPQEMIMEHPAIGGFMTHCGWNSVLEAFVAGLPLITWPLFADQFYNEKLIVELLKIGVRVGTEVWNSSFEIKAPTVGKDKIESAISCLMSDSGEAQEIKRRAKKMAATAKRAVEEGGSSYTDLMAMIEEIKARAFEKLNDGKP